MDSSNLTYINHVALLGISCTSDELQVGRVVPYHTVAALSRQSTLTLVTFSLCLFSNNNVKDRHRHLSTTTTTLEEPQGTESAHIRHLTYLVAIK